MPLAQFYKMEEFSCQFLTTDLVPIDTVDDPGFQKMLKVLEPRYALPDQTTFSRHYLPCVYHKQKGIVSEKWHLGFIILQ